MIDYDKIDPDPIVAEVRKAREEIAAEFDYDLAKIFAEMKRTEATSGRKYVSLPPRTPTARPSIKAG